MDPSAVRTIPLLEKYPFVTLAPGAHGVTFSGREKGTPFQLTVLAEEGGAVATIDDLPFLLFAVSRLVDDKNAGRPLRSTIEFWPSEPSHFLGRQPGGRTRKAMVASLERLRRTSILTGLNQWVSLNLLTAYDVPGGRKPWTVQLPAAFVGEIESGRVMKLDPATLRLRGLARRLAGWAASHCGPHGLPEYRIPLALAHRKAGSIDSPRKFVHSLRSTVGKLSLATHTFSIERRPAGGDELVISRWPSTPPHEESTVLRLCAVEEPASEMEVVIDLTGGCDYEL